MHVNERVAVITGGAQGIGRRTAEVLAERGYALAIIDLHKPARQRRSPSLPQVTEYAGAYHAKKPWAADFAAQPSVCLTHRRVNNAGISLPSAPPIESRRLRRAPVNLSPLRACPDLRQEDA
jgi:NAD(P)-dependent dehydrogenase (short-subunit alcohol dehydrogenase family)